MKLQVKSNSKMMKKKVIIPAFLLVFLNLNISFSQGALTEGKSLDRVAAVVGNEIVTYSEVFGELLRLSFQNPSIDPMDKDLQQRALDEIINEKLFVAKAIEDSVEVSDEEIEARFREVLSNMIRQYGSEKRVEDIVGKPISRIKMEYSDIIKSRLLAEKVKQMKLFSVKLTPKDTEEFFEKFKDSIGTIPEKIVLHHIVKYVNADMTAKESAYLSAKKVRDSIIKGGNFAEFAKRHSADVATAGDGGNLGWFDKGKLFQEFEKAAFALLEGEVSLPIETPFGYHLIQTLEKKEKSINTRHILFKIGQSGDDTERTKAALQELIDKHKAGEDFEELAKKHSDDKESRGFGGMLGEVQLSELPPNMYSVIAKLNDGEVSQPLEFKQDPTKQAYHIIYRKKTIEAHTPDISKDSRTLEFMALEYKKNKMLRDWIEDLRGKIYWEVKN